VNNSPTHDGSKEATSVGNWSQMFIQQGGLRHLFDIFMSGTSCMYYGIWHPLITLLLTLCILFAWNLDSWW